MSGSVFNFVHTGFRSLFCHSAECFHFRLLGEKPVFRSILPVLPQIRFFHLQNHPFDMK